MEKTQGDRGSKATVMPFMVDTWIHEVPKDQLGIRVLVEPNDAQVDVVAIHGLGAIPAITWKEKHSGTNWLSDPQMLPERVPSARIMAFGYDSIYVGRNPVRTSVNVIANGLLEALETHRRHCLDRPLILIGHCFGGLVIEKALLFSQLRQTSVIQTTAGVVFLGTPQRGSETFSDQGEVMSAIAAAMLAPAGDNIVYAEPKVLEALRSMRGNLVEGSEDFSRLCIDKQIPICCFFETRMSDVGKLVGKKDVKEFVVDECSARLDGQPALGLSVDHFALNKFAAPEDGNFKLVCSQIEKMYERGLQLSMSRFETFLWGSVESCTLHLDFEGVDAARLTGLLTGSQSISTMSRVISQKSQVVFPPRAMQPVKHYVGRQSLSSRIREQLEVRDKFAQCDQPIIVLYGLGGAGKSQVALSYIKTYQREYSACFWIAAGSQDSIERDFVNMYRFLYDKLDARNDGLPEVEDMMLAVKSWIMRREGRCLLVFDGADKICNTSDAAPMDLMDFVPSSENLDIIVTTRNPAARDIATGEAIEVDKMTLSESIDLFCKSSGFKKRPDDSDVTPIVEELGHLALAITLAGHYVSRNARLALNLHLYLPEYRKKRKELLYRKPIKTVHQYGESVLTTWETSLEAVKLRSESAAKLLNILAFLNHEDIFSSLFCPQAKSAFSEGRIEIVPEKSWYKLIGLHEDPGLYEIEEIFSHLEDYSLIQRTQSLPSSDVEQFSIAQDGYHMHKLVHAWSFERLSDSDQLAYGLASLQILNDAIDVASGGLVTNLRLVPHLGSPVELLPNIRGLGKNDFQLLADLLSAPAKSLMLKGKYLEAERMRKYEAQCLVSSIGIDQAKTLNSLHEHARTLFHLGRYDEALTMGEDVLERRKLLLANFHPDVLATMQLVGIILDFQGKTQRALFLLSEVVEHGQRVLGRSHQLTVAALSDLANMSLAVGDASKAEGMAREVLEATRTRVGPDHLETFTAMLNLARCLSHRGLFREAVSMNDEGLKGKRMLLGSQHPETMVALGNAGAYLSDAGLYRDAAACHREVLDWRLQNFGKQHPSTLMAMNNMAVAMIKTAKLRDAAIMQQELISLSEKIQGHDHPIHLNRLANFAQILVSLDEWLKAESIGRDVLATRIRVLHQDHPDIAAAMRDLGATLMARGKREEALELFQSGLERTKEVHGPESLLTLGVMNNLAACLLEVGRAAEALDLHKKGLDVKRQVLGINHPSTLVTESNLAQALAASGQLEEALDIQESVADRFSHHMDEDSEDTIQARSNVAQILHKLKKLDRAIELQQLLTARAERVLGPKHSKTLLYKHNHACTLSAKGNFEDAVALEREVLAGRRAVMGRAHESTVIAADHVAYFLIEQEKLVEAKAVLEETLPDGRAPLGDCNSHVLSMTMKLIDISWKLSDLAYAESLEWQVVEAREKTYGRQHRTTLGATNGFVVHLAEREYKMERAEEVCRRLFETAQVCLSPEDEFLARIKWNLDYIVKKNNARDSDTTAIP